MLHNDATECRRRRHKVTMREECVGLLKEDEMNAVADVFGAIFLCFELLLAFSNTTVALPKPTEVVGTVGGTQGAASHGRRSRKARSTSGFASRSIVR